MANRLSENPEWKVLLLEVGDEESDFLTDVPLTAAVTVLTSNFFFHWFFFQSENVETKNYLKGITGATELSMRNRHAYTWKAACVIGQKTELSVEQVS